MTSKKQSKTTYFIKARLNKPYYLDFSKDKSINEKDWYCSELVWAAYKYVGFDIECVGFNEPGITPRDIKKSDLLKIINYK